MAKQGSPIVPNAYAEDGGDIIRTGMTSAYGVEAVFQADTQDIAIRGLAALKSCIDPIAKHLGFLDVDESFDIFDIEFDTRPMGRNTKPVSWVMDTMQGVHGIQEFVHVSKVIFHLRNLIDDQTGHIDFVLMANTFILAMVEAYQRGRNGGLGPEGRNDARIAQGFMVSNAGRWHKRTQEVAANFGMTALDGGAQSYHLFADMTVEERSALRSPKIHDAWLIRNEVENGKLLEACQMLAEEWRFPIPLDGEEVTTATKIPVKLWRNGQAITGFTRMSPEDIALYAKALKSKYHVGPTAPQDDDDDDDVEDASVYDVIDVHESANDLADIEAADEAVTS